MKVKKLTDKNIQELIELYKSGKLVNAENKVTAEINKKPNNFFLYDFLGDILSQREKLDEAVINHKKSIKIMPNYAQGFSNLAGALLKLNKINESLNALKEAIRINPNFAEAYNNLGFILKERKKYNESIVLYQKAIQIKPNYEKAYNNLANVFKIIGKTEESIKCYQSAIKINPNSKIANSNLANLYIDICKVEEAQKCFKKLFDLLPDNIEYKINNGLLVTPIVQSIEEINLIRENYKKSLNFLSKFKFKNENPGNLIEANFFYLAFHNKDNLEIMRNTSNLFYKIIPNINYTSKKIENKKQKKIKIGFISEFLSNHTIGKLFGVLIKNIDRNKFNVTVGHTLQTETSSIKDEIDNCADKVIILGNNVKEQQKQIEDENLDIIFYPEIGMSPTIYFLAFSRLAPAQIVSWGHPETTGINTIDYFFSSTLFEQNKAEKKYSENLICLDEFPLYYEPITNIGPLKNRTELNLPKDVRLYGCPQSLFKLHPDFDSILVKILKKDPEGYIVFIGGKGKYKFWSESLKKRWSKDFSILNDKVLFTNRLSQLEFISFCNCVDVLLDPIYFGGGNTFLESMIVGTPTITLPGNYLKSNITAAAYKQMKITHPPIAKNSEEFVSLATELAKDAKKNQTLRKSLKNAANIHLYKNIKVLKKFEKILEEVHRNSQLGKKLKDGYNLN